MTTEMTSAPFVDLRVSRQYCRQITRQHARNFYYGLALLAEPKRSALFALYAYMRRLDDLADDEQRHSPEQRLTSLDRFQESTHAIYEGHIPHDESGALWPAFADMVHAYELPRHLFDDAIAGQRQDVRGETFETFDNLRQYCYHVAGTVGLASLYIWGYDGGEAAKAMAVDRGIALQLTNILRDLSEDAGRGRVYLCNEDLAQFGLTRSDILASKGSAAFEELMRFEIARAEKFFDQSRKLECFVSADCRASLSTMSSIYRRLLTKIAADPQRVLQQRVSLSTVSKIIIAVGATWNRKGIKDKTARDKRGDRAPCLGTNGQS